MTALTQFGRHLARHWFAWMLVALIILLLGTDLGVLFGQVMHIRVSGAGIALQLVPVLLVCVVLWSVGVRLEAVQRDRERLRAELERAQALGRTGTWFHEGGYFHWSAPAADILGLEGERVSSLDALLVRVAVADRPLLERAWRTASAGAHYRAEVSLTSARGEQRRVLFEGRKELRDDGGRRVAGIVQDMSERYRMEGELRSATSYQRALLDNFPFMVWLKDRDLRFLAVNRPLADAARLPHPDDARGLGDADLWSPEQAMRYHDEDVEVLTTRRPRYSEASIEEDGRRRWYESWSAPVLDDDGELLGMVGYARDIGERKRAEAALARSRDRFDMLGRLQARFIAGEPEELVFPALLDILCDLAGSRDGFLGEIAHDSQGIAHIGLLACRETDWLDVRSDTIEQLLEADLRQTGSGDVVATAGDGPDGPGLICLAVMRAGKLAGLAGLASADGRLDEDRLAGVQAAIGTFGLLLEAGQRERARQQAEAELTRNRDRLSGLIESQLHQTVVPGLVAESARRGRSAFLARVSHELRTPIHAILGFTRIALRGKPPLCDVTQHRFEVIRQNGERLLAQVDELLELSRVEAGTVQLECGACDMDELTGDALDALAPERAARAVSVRRTGHALQLQIHADRRRVLQMLHSVLVHAIRRSPEGGEVELGLCILNIEGRSGVLVTVRDRGDALTGEDGSGPVDPFEPGSGKGDLGLALCREIVALHEGWVRAVLAQDGLAVELWLPASQDADAFGIDADGADAIPSQVP